MTDVADTHSNNAMHKMANAAKMDLNSGVAVTVPTGDEKSPPPRQDDRLALRKAMFKKSDERRATESAQPVDPARKAEIDAMVARATQDGPAVVQNTRQRLQQQEQDEAVATAAAMVQAQRRTAQTQDDNVSLKVGERTITVKRADIERAGGEAMYLRQREMDDRETALIEQQAKLTQQEQDFHRRVQASRNTQGAQPGDPGQGGPANTSPNPGDAVRPGAQGVDVAGMAKDIGARLYSGDETEAVKAIEQILRMAAARGEVVNEDQIAARVEAKLRTVPPAEPKPARSEPVNPLIAAINVKIDTMARAEFPDVCTNEEVRVAAWTRFQRLVKDPANADRNAVDVARDACEWADQTFFNGPRGRVVESKRSLQPVSSASSAVQASDTDDQPLSTSEVIKAIQESRQFGRRR